MFLNSIVLHNFRRFEKLKVYFRNRLSVIVGGNGAGKSTILEAATIANRDADICYGWIDKLWH